MFPLRKCSSDPVLLKPVFPEFLNFWNEKPASRNTSTSSYCGEPLGELLLKISDLEIAQIPKDISRKERMKLEKKVQRNVRRRHSILVANKGVMNEPLSRFLSLSDLSSAPLGSPTKRVSFSVEKSSCDTYDGEESVDLCSVSRKVTPSDLKEVKPKPILIKRDRAQSLPLEHMDIVMFDAFKRGSRISMEVQMDFIRSRNRSGNRRRSQKNWSHPADMLKSLVLQCLSSRRNRTSPADVLCPFSPVEKGHHSLAI